MAANKVLLLDIDGVLIKDRLLLHNVRHNVIKYVQHRVPIKNLDVLQACNLNDTLYKSYGHTLRGMRIAFPKYVDDFTNNDFSKDVYDTKLLNNLHHHINTSDEFKHLHIDFQSVLDKCRDQNIAFHIFSNAPYSWCLPILTAFDISHIVLNTNTIFHCNHKYYNNDLLKPDIALYSNIISELKKTQRLQYLNSNSDSNSSKNRDQLQCIFVDDTLTNLLPILSNEDWKPILYKSLQVNPFYTNTSYIHSISSLSQLKLYLD